MPEELPEGRAPCTVCYMMKPWRLCRHVRGGVGLGTIRVKEYVGEVERHLCAFTLWHALHVAGELAAIEIPSRGDQQIMGLVDKVAEHTVVFAYLLFVFWCWLLTVSHKSSGILCGFHFLCFVGIAFR